VAVRYREGKVVINSRQRGQSAKAWAWRRYGSMKVGTKSATSSTVSPELSIVVCNIVVYNIGSTLCIFEH